MKHEVRIREVHENEKRGLTTDGRPGFISLRQMLDSFGGYEFEFEVADGSKVPVSLEKYRGHDLDETFLQIEIHTAHANKAEADEFDAKAEARRRKPLK